jgi:hypothetical protein
MSFKVRIRPEVARKIAGWGLSDPVLVEVYLRLREVLPLDPLACLRRVVKPFDGMVYEFSFVDPENRFREHFFVFLVVYGQDEESLIVASGGYFRRDGI